MKRYGKYIKPYLGAFVLDPLLMLTEVAGEIMLPKLVSMIINNGVAQRNVQYILSIGSLMILATLVVAIGGIGGAYLLVKVTISFTSDLRADFFSKMQEFSFKNIGACSTGSPITRLTDDIQQVQNMPMMGLRMAMRAPGMLVGALLMAFMMNAGLAMVILVVIPLLTAAIAVILKTAFPKLAAMQKRLDQSNSGTQETLTNVRAIRSFVRGEFEGDKFRVMSQGLEDSSLDTMKIIIVIMPVTTLAMNITTLAVVQYRGNIIIAGDIPIGNLTALTTYIVQILMSLMMLSMVLLQLSGAVTSIHRVSEVMDMKTDLIGQGAVRKDPAILTGKVELKRVSFSYTGNQNGMVLEDISLTAEPGQVIDIIGATGSDKTTLVQMIPRLYDATRGQVLVDEVDVRDCSPKNLREGVDVMLQRDVLFSGIIKENLRWGKEDAFMDEIKEVAQSAQTGSFATSFTSGYDTDMRQGGVNVSGGQKQRLCIARALFKRPEILILGDSTSAVDTTTEARIRQCFSTSLKDTVKIIITQRIGSVEETDRILVLDESRLVGQGTHEQLMEECQAYQETYYSQRDRKGTAAS